MQAGAMSAQPGFSTIRLGTDRFHQLPETWRVIEMNEMANLMCGEVIKHIGRRENETPREIQVA